MRKAGAGAGAGENMKQILICLSLLISLSSFVASAKTYYIGAALPLSGENIVEGISIKNAMELFFHRINENGGINGNKIEIIFKDDKNSKEMASKVAMEFASDDRILAVIGHQFSSTSIAAGETYSRKGLVHITPSASNPQVTRRGKWIFGMNYHDIFQGEQLAIYTKEVLGHRRTSVIYSDTAYGKGLKKSFIEKANKIGLRIGHVVRYGESINYNKIKNDGAVVLLTHMTIGALLVNEISENTDNISIVGPDSLAKKVFIESIGENVDNLYVASPFSFELASLRAKQFFDDYRSYQSDEFAPKPTIWAAFSYDACLLISKALAQKDATRNSIRIFLESMNLSNAIEGITGKLYFDAHGSMIRPVIMNVIDGDKFKPAYIQLKREEKSNQRVGKLLKTKVIYAGIDVSRINKIDSRSQSYELEFVMWLKWKGAIDIDNIYFLNSIEMPNDKEEILEKNFKGEIKYIGYKMRKTFLNEFQHKDFPFDDQKLAMVLSHKYKNSDQVLLIVDHKNLGKVGNNILHQKQWDVIGREDFSGTYRQPSTLGKDILRGNHSFAIYQSNLLVKRSSKPYLIKLFMAPMIILLMSILVFFIPIRHFSVKILYLIGMFISMMIFHFNNGSALPDIGYMSRCDYYYILIYGSLCLFLLITIAKEHLRERKL